MYLYSFYSFSQKMYFCTKSIKRPMQYFNVKRVRRENNVEPRLYLSFTPSVTLPPPLTHTRTISKVQTIPSHALIRILYRISLVRECFYVDHVEFYICLQRSVYLHVYLSNYLSEWVGRGTDILFSAKHNCRDIFRCTIYNTFSLVSRVEVKKK